jgi:flavin reductase (DIM6/NTAB) family NADH-FMN oxidoreductase RutF
MLQTVDLPHAYRLLNHGPTVLVSAAHQGRRNAMAAAWAMPLDFDPPKVALVIDKSTLTRGLVEGSGAFALSVPCRAFADATFTLGSTSGAALAAEGTDKFERYGLEVFAGVTIDAPLLAGCVAWLECRLLRDEAVQQRHDLFVGEVLAARADDRVFSGGRWHFESADDSLRTIHHLGAGAFVVAGERVQARRLGA